MAAHEQHGKFWLKYDDHFDDEGNQFFLEKLLTEKSPSGDSREMSELWDGVSF